jgi:hypothetical protein
MLRHRRGWSAVNDISADERAVVRFATFQLFVVIYLEKIAIGPVTFQISLPLLIMFAGLAWMIVRGRISLSATRLGLYLIFVSCCLFSQLLVNTAGSIPSMLELFLIYWFMTASASAPLSETGYHRVLNNFVILMLPPAIIGLLQYGIQTITGGGDPISMDAMLPKSVLLQGFVYDAHYPRWNDIFQRPNGFFFLEPSFFSFFTASAAIVEITFFRRPVFAILTIAATFLSFGGTGVTMLILASPFLLARESPRLAVPLVVIAVVSVGSAYMLGANLPLISRMNELDTSTGGRASGGDRLVIPLDNFIGFISDPAYLFTGSGAGSTTAEFGNAWPIVKLTHEYGVVAMVSFVVLYISAVFAGGYNLPLKVATAVIFQFTGGYLLSTVLVQFFVIIFTLVEPERDQSRFYDR